MKVRYATSRLFSASPFLVPLVMTGLVSAGIFSLGEQAGTSVDRHPGHLVMAESDSLIKTSKTDDTAVPNIVASMQDSLVDSDADNLADPGESIVYTVTILNNGADTAKGVTFDMSALSPYTTYNGDLSSTVVALGDSFNASSSSMLSVPAISGLLANDIDIDGDIVSVTAPATSSFGGVVGVSNDGSFSFLPVVGKSGVDSFQYVITDDDGNSDSAVVKINLTSTIFFVKASASPGGDGSFTTPFQSIAELKASPKPSAGDTIYFYSGSYTGSITLLANQKLFGQGSALTTSILNIPAGADPTITPPSGAAVMLASGNTVRGFTLSNGASGTGIYGTGSLGTISVENTTILLDATGTGVNFPSASGNITFDSSSPIIADPTPTGAKAISITTNNATIAFNGAIGSNGTGITVTNSTGSVSFTGGMTLSTGTNTAFSASGGTVQVSGTNTVTTSTATAVSLSNVSLGTGVTLQSISTNGAANGVVLSNTSGGAFTVTGTGSTDASGGTIQNASNRGFAATTTSNQISLSNMQFTNNGAANPGTCILADLSGCGAHLFFGSTSAATTLNNVDLSGGIGQGILGWTVSGFTYQNGSLSNVGGGATEDGINLNGVSGTVTITNSTIANSFEDNVSVAMSSGSTTLAITNNTITNGGTTIDDAIQIDVTGGTLNADVTGNTIGSHVGRSLRAFASQSGYIASLDVTGNTLTTGVDLRSADTSTLQFNLNSNTSIGSPTSGAAVVVRGFDTGTVNGRINGNATGLGIAPSSNAPGIDAALLSNATGVLEISNNVVTLSSTGNSGVSLWSDGTLANPANSPTLDVTMSNNTINAGAGGFPLEGVLAGADYYGNTCVNISNTSVSVSYLDGFYGVPSASQSTLEMQGFLTTVAAWWTAGGNTGSGSSSGSGTFMSGICTTVTHPLPSANPIAGDELGADRDSSVDGAVEFTSTDILDPNLSSIFEETPLTQTVAQSATTLVPPATFSALIGSLPPGKQVVLSGSFTVDNYSAGVSEIVNQGTVTGANFATVVTDDPDSGTANDATSTIVDEGSALPVELVSLTTVVDGSDVVLSWQTASETNNAGFEIQRSTAAASDATFDDWQEVAWVEGAGTTDRPRTYTYTLDKLEPGRYGFRLKQIDFDGAFDYSPVVEAIVEVPRELSLNQNYPNPFNPQTNITFTVPSSGHASLAVYSMLGRRVATLFEGDADAGKQYTLSLNAESLATGQYVYVLDFNGRKVSKTMLVVR